MSNKIGCFTASSCVNKQDYSYEPLPKKASLRATNAEIPSVLRDNGLQWLAVSGVRKNTLSIKPILIEAPADSVWSLVKSVDRYSEFSGGKCDAHMANGLPVATGNAIDLSLTMKLDPIRQLFFGSNLAHSKETVILENKEMALGWHRTVPLTCGAEAERWQIVVPNSDNTCVYYSGLHVPAFVGRISMSGVGHEILTAFVSIGNGIKAAAEGLTPCLSDSSR